MQHLFKSPKNKKSLPDSVEKFSGRLLEAYDRGVTRWHFPALDDRPKPEALVQLEEQEYWRMPGEDRTQLRPGHDVYIRTKILDSIASYFGPQSKENCIKQYSFALLTHMVGGQEVAHKLWSGKFFADGVRGLLVYDDLIAVCLHADQVFHLIYSIKPAGAMHYANLKLQRKNEYATRQAKHDAEGCRQRRPKNLLHDALNV